MEVKLWNHFEENDIYAQNQELYKTHILEQYKMYVEMTDRVSARRNFTNTFFLSLHTTILAVIGFTYDKMDFFQEKWLAIFPFVGIIALCLIWWLILFSFRKLNSAKHKVAGALEKRLPASPYWTGEWSILDRGGDIKKYIRLTMLERVIPLVFASFYVMILLYLLIWG